MSDHSVSEMVIHDKLIDFFKSFKAGSHPMAIMVGVVGALSAFDKVTNSYDMSEEHREATCIKLIAKIPMIAAIAFRTSLVRITNCRACPWSTRKPSSATWRTSCG